MRAGAVNIILKIKGIVCGGGDVKSIAGETMTNAKWSSLALVFVVTAWGIPAHGLFRTFASLSIVIALLRILMEACKYPHSSSPSGSGLESNNQIHDRNNRFTHDFRMATSAAALSIFIAYIVFLLYYGVSIWQGFKFWFDYVGS
jgi:hypothetical protein